MAIRTPDRHKPTLIALATLPDDAMNRLREILKSWPLPNKSHAGNLSGIIEMLISMHLGKEDNDTLDVFASGVVKGLLEDDPGVLSSTDAPILQQRLTDLLGQRSFYAGVKETQLRAEYEHVFRSARIVTDMRPVFEEDLSAPHHAFIGHTLKVEYSDRNAIKQIYIAMDSADLEALGELIERAKKKEQIIENISLRPVKTETQ